MAAPPLCNPGDLFAIPLESGGYGLILVAYWSKGGWSKGSNTIFCFGFSGRWETVDQVPMTPRSLVDVVCVEVCEDVCISEKRWTYVGVLQNFRQEEWPIPPERTSGPGEKKPELGPLERLRFVVTNGESLANENLLAAPFVTLEEYLRLPLMTGYGIGGSMEVCLSRAMNGDPRHMVIPDGPVWKRINDAVIEQGLMPVDERPRRGKAALVPRSIWNAKVEFWDLIEEARTKGGEDEERFLEVFRDGLIKQGAKRLPLLARACRNLIQDACLNDFWGIAYLMNEGTSPDGFLYFRAWLIAQGRKNFDKVVWKPDSLASVEIRYGAPGAYEMEELLLAFSEAAEELNVEEPEVAREEHLGYGKKLWSSMTEQEIKKLVPKVWKKYGAASD